MEYDGLITKPTLEELYHNGVKGQKWGVQNGPPYPLDSKISTGKRLKKKNGKISKGKKERKLSKNSQNLATETTDPELEYLIELEKWASSGGVKRIGNKAYDATYDWFKKYDPEYLDDIISKNGGRHDGLTGFHDFRKVFEGYEDELGSQDFEEWKKRQK